MPFIAPRFLSNNTPSAQRAPAPISRPPWLRGPVPGNNDQQGNNGAPFIPPWRKNIRRSTGDPNNSSYSGSGDSTLTTAPTTAQSPQQPQLATGDPQTKTSTLQINLKSVKKPDQSPQLQQSNIATLPLVAKVIPIPIVIQKDENPPALTKIIPIQRVNPQEQLSATVEKELDSKMPKAIAAGGPPPPPAPPPPPCAPPPPPPPEVKQAKIEKLRKPPKKRPDWAGMMKEIEKGRVLNHVQCDDRSKPMLSRLKSRGKFVYESEAKPATKSDAIHNRIFHEIQQGVKLKKVHCNDRSKPILTGLRVRRQSSVMEGEGFDGVSAPLQDPVSQLAFMDIDDLRDELQSAKQLLQTEVESKHSLERKARDQKCQIIAMEAEIETLKAKLGIIPEEDVSVLAKSLEKSDSKTFRHLKKSGSSLWKSPSGVGLKKSRSGLAKGGASDANINKLDGQTEDDINEMNEYEEEIVSLKEAVQHAKKQADEMEAKYKEAMEKLQSVQNNFEDSEQKRKDLERQVDNLQAQQDGSQPVPSLIQTAERMTQTEEQILEKTGGYSRQQSTMSNAGDDYDGSDSEEEESDMEVNDDSVLKKKQERELKLWENKVKSVKDKQNTSRLERKNLKNLQKKLETELKDANKRHNKLQKEVDKMAKMLKDADKEMNEDDEEEEEDEEKEEPEDEESEEEEEEESEEEESDSDNLEDDESSEEDDDTATFDDRLAVFGKRVKRRENVLMALRKGNYLLRANIDRLKDDLEEERIAYHDLEHELNSVLEDV